MSKIGIWRSAGEQQRAADRFEDIGGNAIVYTYPDGCMDVVCASNKWWTPPGWEDAEDWGRAGRRRPEPAKREKGKKSEGDDLRRSMRRARAQLRRLALANGFDYFVTLTLDGEKIDRYDGAAITRALNQWCNNMVKRHGLRYILVPELHKDGAFHFHGFFAGDGLEAVDSGTLDMDGWKHPRRPRSQAERQRWLDAGARVVYNLPQWRLGFTSAIKLYGSYAAAVGYCCKYIGKQEGQRPLGRWYYSGGALAKPEKTYVCMDYQDLAAEKGAVQFDIPGSRMVVLNNQYDKTDKKKEGRIENGG